jgi:hypothetical protein
MIGSTFIVHLHRHDGFISLQVRCPQQILAHGRHHRLQQFPGPHHPAI